MLIHITPRIIFTGEIEGFSSVALADLSIAELGLYLRGGRDLTTRTPYPNKTYLVACRKVGNKATTGILINAAKPIRTFTTVARWAIDAETLVTHRTKYVITDDDFDAVSDNMVLWYGFSGVASNWVSRWPNYAEGLVPASDQPRMDLRPGRGITARRQNEILERLSPDGGFVVERDEVFRIPTIEPGRLANSGRSKTDRLPPMESAFTVA